MPGARSSTGLPSYPPPPAPPISLHHYRTPILPAFESDAAAAPHHPYSAASDGPLPPWPSTTPTSVPRLPQVHGAWGYAQSDNDQMRLVIMNYENERLRREQELIIARERNATERERFAAETARIKLMVARANMAAALETFVSAPPPPPPGHGFSRRY